MPKQIYDIPKNLNDMSFYGLKLNKEQVALRDAIWSDNNLIVFSDSKAGTGKSFISIATAVLLVKYGLYEGITYIISPTQEAKQGYLPGSLDEKTQPYFQPLYQALAKVGENPISAISNCSIMNKKNGMCYVDAMPHTFLRGTTFENRVIIIDEAQNFYDYELKKVLTRVSDNCKTIVIGHSGQNDLISNREKSGFVKYLNHFKNQTYCSVCNLYENYRGVVSNFADDLPT